MPRWSKRITGTPYVGSTGRSKHASTFIELDKLVCYGCMHSAAAMPYPSMPSGERPCQFCIRNQHRTPADELMGRWYDGSEPLGSPMDAYITFDLRDQIAEWVRMAESPTQEEKDAAVEGLLAIRERNQ